MNSLYTLRPTTLCINTPNTKFLLLLHDMWDDYTELDAQVKSGDYFIQLATLLDALQNTQDANEASHQPLSLDRIIRDLLYLDARYQIRKRPRDDA